MTTQGRDAKTQTKDRHAWYLYYAAYEPVSIVVLQLLFPLLINSMSLLASHRNDSPTVHCTLSDPSSACHLFSLPSLTPSSFAYLVTAVSVAAQTVAFVSCGALADYGRWRGVLLYGCTAAGGIAAMTVFGVAFGSEKWLSEYPVPWLIVIAALFVLLQVVFGTASICYNAILPLLAAGHPQADSPSPAAVAVGPPEQSPKAQDEQRMNEISLKGMIAGYATSLIALFASSLILKILPGASVYPNAVPIAVLGAIWLVVGCVAIRLISLAHTPGLRLPTGTSSLVAFSWRRTLSTLRSLSHLPNLRLFLICYLFFSDGYGTIGLVAVLFAETEMHMSSAEIAMSVAFLLIACIVGTAGYMYLKKGPLRSVSSVGMIIGLCVVQSLIPLYGLLGIVPSLPIGFKQSWEAHLIAVYYGLNIGACHSFARVAFAELLPPGREAEYFSLFAITDKGSAILGPLLLGLCKIMSEEQRWGLIFLLLMLWLPLPFLRMVNVEDGVREASTLVSSGTATPVSASAD